jgi:hypothetical protein
MELDELRKLQREMQGAAREFEQTVSSAASDVQAGVRNVERELNEPAASAPAGEPTPAAAPGGAQPPDTPASRQAALPGFDKI